jgi:hypothetical protein
MSRAITIILICILSSTHTVLANDTETWMDQTGLDIQFRDSERYGVEPEEQSLITDIIAGAEERVRALVPALPANISVIVTFVDEGFDYWGTSMGLNGRSDAPGVVVIDISTGFPGGISAAVNKNLSRLVFHEFHHQARGWTMTGNKFGPGIPIAAVNEGLAVVFSEQYADGTFEKLSNPENGDLWLKEILALPIDANYGHWMSQHPDGRFAIGYRTGMYLVNKAMTDSGKNILELSRLSPDEILGMVAGAAP